MKLLNEIQQKIKAPKTQKNTHGGYMYRSCSDILSAVKPFLTDGVAFLHMTDELVQVGDKNYVKATVTLTQGSEKMVATGFAREADEQKGMNAGQLSCSTSSYARKLALSGLFAIDDSHDTGNGTGNGKDKPRTNLAAVKAVYAVFVDKHADALPDGFEFSLDAFKKAVKAKAAEEYKETPKWTEDVVTTLAVKIKPKEVWIQSKE